MQQVHSWVFRHRTDVGGKPPRPEAAQQTGGRDLNHGAFRLGHFSAHPWVALWSSDTRALSFLSLLIALPGWCNAFTLGSSCPYFWNVSSFYGFWTCQRTGVVVVVVVVLGKNIKNSIFFVQFGVWFGHCFLCQWQTILASRSQCTGLKQWPWISW